ncbi:hypothetical protein [Brachybacterium sp. GPGPB12]|uniref:hypothetical protein n=1 Tax=Brachybacterium sp. GPGPB12 TaxID=3023517 RepID=UPI0031342B69
MLRIGPDGLDVHPTGADPRVPVLEGLPLQVTARPAQCPPRGEDGRGPCRPVGGPWIRASQEARLDWEARRAQAVAMLGRGVCFGEARHRSRISLRCRAWRRPRPSRTWAGRTCAAAGACGSTR